MIAVQFLSVLFNSYDTIEEFNNVDSKAEYRLQLNLAHVARK